MQHEPYYNTFDRETQMEEMMPETRYLNPKTGAHPFQSAAAAASTQHIPDLDRHGPA